MNNLNEKNINLPNMAVEVTPQLEERIRNANKEAHSLHLAVLPTVYVEVGLEGGSSTKYKANSFNRNFYNLLIFDLFGITNTTNTFGTGSLIIKDTNSNLQGIGKTGYELYGFYGGKNGADAFTLTYEYNYRGILIGSGTAAEDFNGYKLANQIMDGIDANQLKHYAPSKLDYNYDAVNKKWSQSYKRNFENKTTANITITETALYGYSGGYMMFERTLLSTPFVVPPGKMAKITYTFEFMYPEPAVTV